MNKKVEKELFRLQKKACMNNEVPIAAVIVYKNNIISKAYNKKIGDNNPLSHAEIIAIQKAAKKLGDWRLDDCELYVTLEPCDMCKEVIKESRIKKVFYYISKNKKVNRKTEFILIQNSTSPKYKELLTNFFEEIR